MTENHRYDIVVLGAGLAGSCLARQLKLAQPELSIAVIEARTEFGSWVGESTTEVFVDYAQRHLGLGPYLAKRHIVKQSLRYYWDSEARDLPLAQMSEFGVNGYHGQLSYQLDRAAMDRDLCEMNRQLGVDVFLGTRVFSRASDCPIEIDREQGHVVRTDRGEFRCRWLVDAAGRSSPLCRSLGLGGPDSRHPIGSYWARLRNVGNIDDMGDAAWVRRSANIQRYLATNHFMYPGYWFWLIPLAEDTVSLGVTYDPRHKPLKLKNAEAFTAFAREHRCLNDLLGPAAEVCDFQGLRHVARHASQIYSADGWFLTGMAGVFADPFLSMGGTFLALGNRMIGEMIASDRAGDTERMKRQAVGFERYLKTIYNNLRLTNDHATFGSFDIVGPARRAGQLAYHNTLIPTGMEDLQTLIDQIDAGEGPADDGPTTFAVARQRLVQEYSELLGRGDDYFAMNQGEYWDGSVPEQIKKKYHLPRDLALEGEFLSAAWVEAFHTYAMRLCERSGRPVQPQLLRRCIDRDWTRGQTLASCLEELTRPLELTAS